jgi:hypothetical protein
MGSAPVPRMHVWNPLYDPSLSGVLRPSPSPGVDLRTPFCLRAVGAIAWLPTGDSARGLRCAARILGQTVSGLRVVRRATPAPRGHRGGQEQKPRVAPSAPYAARRGCVGDAMPLRPACGAQALQRWPHRIRRPLLRTGHEGGPLSNTRTPCALCHAPKGYGVRHAL